MRIAEEEMLHVVACASRPEVGKSFEMLAKSRNE
jgi:hypothetical protein